jgi:hypothetical protein
MLYSAAPSTPVIGGSGGNRETLKSLSSAAFIPAFFAKPPTRLYYVLILLAGPFSRSYGSAFHETLQKTS